MRAGVRMPAATAAAMSDTLLLFGLEAHEASVARGSGSGAQHASSRRKRARGKRGRPQSARAARADRRAQPRRTTDRSAAAPATRGSAAATAHSPHKQSPQRRHASTGASGAYTDTSLLRMASPGGRGVAAGASSPALRAALAAYSGSGRRRARPQSATVRQRATASARGGQQQQRSGAALRRSNTEHSVIPSFKLGLGTSLAPTPIGGAGASTSAARRPSFSCGPVRSPARAMAAVRCCTRCCMRCCMRGARARKGWALRAGGELTLSLRCGGCLL